MPNDDTEREVGQVDRCPERKCSDTACSQNGRQAGSSASSADSQNGLHLKLESRLWGKGGKTVLEEEHVVTWVKYCASFLHWNVKTSDGKDTPGQFAATELRGPLWRRPAVSVAEALGYGIHNCAATELLKSLQWRE